MSSDREPAGRLALALVLVAALKTEPSPGNAPGSAVAVQWPGGRSVVVATIEDPAGQSAVSTASNGVFSEAAVSGFASPDFTPGRALSLSRLA